MCTAPPDNGRLLIMPAGRVLGSTAHTSRPAFVLVVVAVVLVVLLTALPWDDLAQLLPRGHG